MSDVSGLWGAMYSADTVVKVAVKDMAKQDEGALRRDANVALPSSLASAGKGLAVGGTLGGLAEGGAAAALGGGARAALRAALSGALQGGAIGGALGGLLGVAKRSRTADARSAAQLELLHRDGQNKAAPGRGREEQRKTAAVDLMDMKDPDLRGAANSKLPNPLVSAGTGALLGGALGVYMPWMLGARSRQALLKPMRAGALLGGALGGVGGLTGVVEANRNRARARAVLQYRGLPDDARGEGSELGRTAEQRLPGVGKPAAIGALAGGALGAIAIGKLLGGGARGGVAGGLAGGVAGLNAGHAIGQGLKERAAGQRMKAQLELVDQAKPKADKAE